MPANDSSPRVVLVTNDFPPKVGGIQVNHEQLFPYLNPDRLWVLAANHPKAKEYDATAHYYIERISATTMLPSPNVARKLKSLIRRVQPDVVIFGSALPLSLLGPVATRAGVPYVTMVYGAEISVAAKLPLKLLLTKALAGAAGIVAFGPWVANQVSLACSPPIAQTRPTLTLMPGVDAGIFSPGDATVARKALNIPTDRPTVVSVSRLVPRKGMHHLIRASAALAAQVPDVQIVIGGSGRQLGRLRREVESRGLDNTVKILGQVPHGQLVDLYRAGDVFTMLCHDRWFGLEQEGFGIVFAEAGACAVPVVAGRSGGSVDAVTPDVTGTLVDATDYGEVARSLARYLMDPALATRHGANGRHMAETTFSWARQRESFIAWLHEHFGAS